MKRVIANLKMNQTPSETKDYLIKLVAGHSRVADKAQITICMPFTSLHVGKFLLSGTDITYAGQNLFEEEFGSFTGEVSGSMLKDIGASSVIVGHSDRRIKFKENNKTINKKIKTALKNSLEVILCVGESLAEKNTLKTLDTLKTQIEEGLKGLYENELEKIVIAYEPIWAIGNGKNATAREIEYAVKMIRKVIAEDFSQKASDDICVLYGGSVNAKNVNSIINIKGVDGVLIGAASRDVVEFLNIISLIK